jgi:type VI secretion system protein ImpM
MSSLDGLGRYYPLTLFAYSDQGATIAPPDLDAHDEWFSLAEDFLLSTLDRDVAFEAITESLNSLAPPVHRSTAVLGDGNLLSSNGMLGNARESRSFPDLFASLREANFSSIYSAGSFWWTIGGGEFAPFGFCCKRMPDPFIFTAMLTGRFTDSG